MKAPPVLNNMKLVQQKIKMVDSLLEIEIAYNLLHASSGEDGEDPIDAHYKQLKTDFEVVERTEDDWKMVQDYIKNTHGDTHRDYSLEMIDLFKVSRQGEKKKSAMFKKIKNHQLLWHGSRITNFAGILSQGLRIAPPEAPVSGYMFGKGVYFADMVSKSANYCRTSKDNPIGAMMLCEVALGDAYELTSSEFVTKLPKGKHHCKGLGENAPNPNGAIQLDDMTVPMGKAQKTNIDTCLLYNEFIVYDVAQIQAKFLIKLKFNHKY